MAYATCYAATLMVFLAIDAVWLSTMSSALYRPTLGDILAPNVRIGPTIAFYLIYPAGIVFFAGIPAMRADSIATALLFGALLGALAYATYDLTNFATLRNWTLQITLIDIVWGAALTGVAAAAGLIATRTITGLPA